MIDEFESHDDFPTLNVKGSISIFWEDVSEVVINPYKSDNSVLTDGYAVTQDGQVDFILINTSGIEL